MSITTAQAAQLFQATYYNVQSVPLTLIETVAELIAPVAPTHAEILWLEARRRQAPGRELTPAELEDWCSSMERRYNVQ